MPDFVLLIQDIHKNEGVRGLFRGAIFLSMLSCVALCCSVLQCVAVCCSVLQCVAVCCSVLQRVAVCCGVLQCVLFMQEIFTTMKAFVAYFEVQCVAAC